MSSTAAVEENLSFWLAAVAKARLETAVHETSDLRFWVQYLQRSVLEFLAGLQGLHRGMACTK